MKVLIVSFFVLLTVNSYADEASCDGEQFSLYKELSKPDVENAYFYSMEEDGIFKEKKTRRIVASTYAELQNENGKNYVVVGMEITLPSGKNTTAYYLLDLNVGLRVSNDRKAFYEIEGDFLGYSDDKEDVESKMSFLPFQYVTDEDFKKFEAALINKEFNKEIFKSKDNKLSVDAFIASKIFAYTHIKYHNQKGAGEAFDLAKVRLGFKAKYNDAISFAIYIKGGVGYAYSSETGLKHVGLDSAGIGLSLKYQMNKNLSAYLMYEYEKIPTFKHKHKSIKIGLNFKFRGFEYIYEDLSKAIKRL